jgi:Zn-dependent protease with chaperone function
MGFSKTLLVGLKADQFRHPLDLAATNSLKQIPGLDLMVRNLLGPLAEQFFYLNNIAASILVGENQLPHLHKLLLEACETLDLEPPQLYVQQHPVPNAYTFAMRGKQPFIVLHTSLIEILTPEEIQAVIAHELGCAEFTCDRAALLATQNPRVVMSVLMKLAGGSPTLAPQLNLDAFIAQARAYDDVSNSELGELLKSAQTAQLTHPVPVLRAREIDRWASSQTYQFLLQQRSIGYNDRVAPQGGWRNW